ncbi:MAG TPA: hypothetical protein VF174_07850 [Micromonosporaceae bacterium]
MRRITPHRSARLGALAAGLFLAGAVLAGCASDGASTDCGLDECIVTFDRGVQAEAGILGVEAKFVSADEDTVTVEVAGERLSLRVDGPGTEVAGLWVSVHSADEEQVAIRIGRQPD